MALDLVQKTYKKQRRPPLTPSRTSPASISSDITYSIAPRVKETNQRATALLIRVASSPPSPTDASESLHSSATCSIDIDEAPLKTRENSQGVSKIDSEQHDTGHSMRNLFKYSSHANSH